MANITVSYVAGTKKLHISHTSHLNHGDTVTIQGIPDGATHATLSCAHKIFKGDSPYDVRNGTVLTVSSHAKKGSDTIKLSFHIPNNDPGTAEQTATGTLDPTGKV
ncbi:hypothetical protein P2318_24705 [Myxococcaceae bacterium GXIMD 01537]